MCSVSQCASLEPMDSSERMCGKSGDVKAPYETVFERERNESVSTNASGALSSASRKNSSESSFSTSDSPTSELPSGFRWPLWLHKLGAKSAKQPGKLTPQQCTSCSVSSTPSSDTRWLSTTRRNSRGGYRRRSLGQMLLPLELKSIRTSDLDSTTSSTGLGHDSPRQVRRVGRKSKTYPNGLPPEPVVYSRWYAASLCPLSNSEAHVRKSRRETSVAASPVVPAKSSTTKPLPVVSELKSDHACSLLASSASSSSSVSTIHSSEAQEKRGTPLTGAGHSNSVANKATDNGEKLSSNPKKQDLQPECPLLNSEKASQRNVQESMTVSVGASTQTTANLPHLHRRRLSVSRLAPCDEDELERVRKETRGTSKESSRRHKRRETPPKLRLSATAPGSHKTAPSVYDERKSGCARRFSISGLPSIARQHDFEEKLHQIYSDSEFFDPTWFSSYGIGYTCKKGLKPESPNQDDFFMFLMEDWALYGVFDGHGPYGHHVSNFVQKRLPRLIYDSAYFLTNPKQALWSSFIMVHKLLEMETIRRGTFNCSMSGCTASVILHKKKENKLYIAYVGDSRCVLGRQDSHGPRAVDLTFDHKPNSDVEHRRILAAGGEVGRLQGDVPYRVFLKGRQYPGLAMTRAIGDTIAVQAGVTCEPDILEYTIDPRTDLFVTLCSDGVWEFMQSQEVIDMIHANGPQAVQYSADLVAQESWARWIEEGSVVDDITVEIVYLQH